MKKAIVGLIILLLAASCARMKPAVKEEPAAAEKISAEEAAKMEQELKKQEAEKYFSEGVESYRQENDSLAQSYWRKAVEILPDDAELHNFIGLSLHRQGRIKMALNEFETALENDPTYYEAYNNAGYMWLLLNNYDRAKAAFKQSLTYSADYQPALKNMKLVESLIKGKLSKEAFNLTERAAKSYDSATQVKILKDVIKIDSTYAKAHNNLAVAYYYEDKIDSAFFFLNKALGLQKDYPEAVNNLGYLFKVAGKYDQAIKLFLKALALKPKYISAFNNLGETYFLNGDQANAKRVFDTVTGLDPGNETAKMWLEKM